MTFFGETEHFSGKNGALRWSILVGKQKYNVQKPNPDWQITMISLTGQSWCALKSWYTGGDPKNKDFRAVLQTDLTRV